MTEPTDISSLGSADAERGTDLEVVPAKGLMARFGIACIRFYQRNISPLTPPTCRYSPTCSAYTLTAIQRYGFVKGSWMGMGRISRCHPFHEGGYDPVP